MSDEERKKKEKKNFTVLTSILASLSAIVESLPCVKGQPLVTVWGQIVIDRLHDFLTHSNADIRCIAGGTLATFSLICSGGGRVEDTYVPHTSHTVSTVPSKEAASPRSIENSTYAQNTAGTQASTSVDGRDGGTSSARAIEREKVGRQDVNTQALSSPTTTGAGSGTGVAQSIDSDSGRQEQIEEKDDDGAWLIEACLSRVGSSLSSAFEKKSK